MPQNQWFFDGHDRLQQSVCLKSFRFYKIQYNLVAFSLDPSEIIS